MSETNDEFNPFDPTGMFKSMHDANMATWSKMMVQLVNSDAYAQATATMLDAWLTSSMPFRKAMEMTMTQALTNLNMPTRTDVISIAERLTNVEMRWTTWTPSSTRRRGAASRPLALRANTPMGRTNHERRRGPHAKLRRGPRRVGEDRQTRRRSIGC